VTELSTVSPPSIVLGANVFGWSVSAEESPGILDAAFELGMTAIDTADVYSHWVPGNQGGESETIIGNWMKARGNRSRVQIHTKGGAPGAPGELANANATGAYLTKAVDASLRRLGIDCIDLYYVHYDDKVTPPEDTLGCFQRLIEAGKIRAIGASNYSPERLTLAMETAAKHGLPQFSVLQTHYNLADRAVFEKDLRGVCDRFGLGVMAYYALAKGFLSGKYRSAGDAKKSAARGGGATSYLNARGLRILDALDSVAARHHSNPAQVALSWLAAKPRVRPIASATSIGQLDDLTAAMKLRLSAEDMAALGDASREG
jgi:aryl-alcohol dehydrogenase (NADP+)